MISSILGLAAEQARWLSLRGTLVARNIANANTPNFEAKDIRPFQNFLESQSIQLAATNKSHMTLDAPDIYASSFVTKAKDSEDASLSGNSVDLEKELEAMGDVNRMYALNTSIVKSFHRMMLLAAK